MAGAPPPRQPPATLICGVGQLHRTKTRFVVQLATIAIGLWAIAKIGKRFADIIFFGVPSKEVSFFSLSMLAAVVAFCWLFRTLTKP
jgi:hypothetical protein